MKRLRDFINEKILPEIRNRRINSYRIFCQFKRNLIPQKVINNEYFLSSHELDYKNEDDLKFMTLLLKKRYEQRSQIENSSLIKCFRKIHYFQQLQNQTDQQVTKALMKTVRVIKVDKKSVIFDEGEQVKYYYILLKGRIGILENSYKSYINDKLQSNLLNTLVKNLVLNEVSEIKQPKKKKKKSNKKVQHVQTVDSIGNSLFDMHKLEIEQLEIQKQIQVGYSFGDEIHNIHSHRKISAVAMEDSYLIQLTINTLFKAIKNQNDKKLQKQIEFFRKFRCFDLLEDHQLSLLILTAKIQQKPMNQYIFKQGDVSKQFYLIIEGEIAINKVAKLFLENPNKLYMNRLSWEKDKKNIKILPYANFENLYNYRPKQSLIELGILGKQNLLGQEEVFVKKRRQTNAKVISNVVKYYTIDIIQLENILKQKKYELQDFKDFLFGTTTKKKILYRQDKFSEVLNLKNKKNLDYFYIQNQQVESPKKFRIQKINNKFNYTEVIIKKQAEKDETLKPYFTPFNFNKFINGPESPQVEQNQQNPTVPEKMMIELTHTTRLIQKQLHSENKLAGIKNPEKRSININSPLFDDGYFTSINKRYKKLERQERKKRFSIHAPLLTTREKTRFQRGYS